MDIDEVNLKRGIYGHIHSNFKREICHRPTREEQINRRKIRANPGFHERITEKYRNKKADQITECTRTGRGKGQDRER